MKIEKFSVMGLKPDDQSLLETDKEYRDRKDCNESARKFYKETLKIDEKDPRFEPGVQRLAKERLIRRQDFERRVRNFE